MGSADKSSPGRVAPAKVSSWLGHAGWGARLHGSEVPEARARLGCPWGPDLVPGSHLGGDAEHTDSKHVGMCGWHMAGDGWRGNGM